MPMGEDLSKTVPHMSHQRLEKVSLHCIQLSEPPIPLPSPTFCFDQGSGALRAIISANSSMLVRDRISEFEGHTPATSIKSVEGKAVVASAEVVDLSVSLFEFGSQAKTKGTRCSSDNGTRRRPNTTGLPTKPMSVTPDKTAHHNSR
jgi:hypothetical protein